MKTKTRFSGKRLAIMILILFSGIHPLRSQVSVNFDQSGPDPSAMLEIKSVDRGLLLPRLDYLDRPAVPTAGLLIFFTVHAPFGKGIYYSDGIHWMKLAPVNYYPGQNASGGIVFYVDSTGHHGLAAAPADDASWHQWGCDSLLIGPGAQHWALGTGNLNTFAILDSCPQPETGAAICQSLALSGFSDWYLPSIIELDTLLARQNIVGGFEQSQWYMSSTEVDSTMAMAKYNESFYLPYEFTLGKQYWIKVRCIRKF